MFAETIGMVEPAYWDVLVDSLLHPASLTFEEVSPGSNLFETQVTEPNADDPFASPVDP